MKPPTIPSPEKTQDDLSSTLGALISAFEYATAEARDTAAQRGYDGSFYSHQVRYEAKRDLKLSGIESEDCDVEDVPNTGICISLPGYSIRVLRSQDGEVPSPGESERRKRFLSQQPEQMNMFEKSSDENAEEDTEPIHIVLLWEDDQDHFFTGFWLICPSGIDSYHFKVWIPRPEFAVGFNPPTPTTPPAPVDDLEGIGRREDTEAVRKSGTDSAPTT